MKKRLLSAIMAVLVLSSSFLLSGCDIYNSSDDDDNGRKTSISKDDDETTINNHDTREYTEFPTENSANEFFQFRVDDAQQKYSVDGFIPNEEENTHLRVDVTVENITSYEIPIGNPDFIIRWGDGEDDWNSACSEFTEGQYPDEENLGSGDTKEASLYFIVPSGYTDFDLEYTEYFEDESTGDTYTISIKVPEQDADERQQEIEDNRINVHDTKTAEQGEYVGNDEFQYILNSAETSSTIDEYTSEDGYIYLTANVTIQNNLSAEMPIRNGYFEISWGDEEWDYAYMEFRENQIPDEGTLAAGASITGDLIFSVPSDETAFSLDYYDWYEDSDKNDCDIYSVTFTPHATVSAY